MRAGLSWPSDKATIFPMEKNKLAENEKGETGEEQSQQHVILHQGDCSQRICPGRPNSQFRMLL
jgi:hypothetical protein